MAPSISTARRTRTNPQDLTRTSFRFKMLKKLSNSTPAPPFAQGADLPDALQGRLDSWYENPPKWQHQMYGPLNAYFHHVFPPSAFLVKPQALLRGVVTTPGEDASIPGDGDTPQGELLQEISPQISTDSHNVPVNKTRQYPDFDIDQYWCGEGGDIVRFVVEVGSLGGRKTKSSLSTAQVDIEHQLITYLAAVGKRAKEDLIGIGMLGNEVVIFEAKYLKDGSISRRTSTRTNWVSMFDTRIALRLVTLSEKFQRIPPPKAGSFEEGEEEEDL